MKVPRCAGDKIFLKMFISQFIQTNFSEYFETPYFSPGTSPKLKVPGPHPGCGPKIRWGLFTLREIDLKFTKIFLAKYTLVEIR